MGWIVSWYYGYFHQAAVLLTPDSFLSWIFCPQSCHQDFLSGLSLSFSSHLSFDAGFPLFPPHPTSPCFPPFPVEDPYWIIVLAIRLCSDSVIAFIYQCSCKPDPASPCICISTEITGTTRSSESCQVFTSNDCDKQPNL